MHALRWELEVAPQRIDWLVKWANESGRQEEEER